MLKVKQLIFYTHSAKKEEDTVVKNLWRSTYVTTFSTQPVSYHAQTYYLQPTEKQLKQI